MSQFSRRDFLKSSLAVAGGTFAIGGTKASGKLLGSNDRVRVAVAGVHGRGKSHIDAFAKLQGVEVAYVVDPDSRLFDGAIKQVENIAGNRPKPVQDIRQVLDDPNVDAVSVATPNHWHSLITIWACQAGKDVYVEKPMSHNVHEGRVAVEAARKYGRIVQHGTQSRSDEKWARLTSAARSGKYGKLLVSKGYCCKPRWSIGFKPNASPPDGLDFNIWLGPAPEQPFHENLVHYNWHWFWDFGNGDTGNQGVHQMDIARWAIGKTLPNSVWSLGGRFGYEDQGQTPNTQLTVYDYGDEILLFETRGLVGKFGQDRIVTNEFYTSEGRIADDGKFYPHNGGEPVPVEATASVNPGGAFGSFINAVRSRSVGDLNADVLEGHYSAALCHLANISYRLGSPVPFHKKTQRLGDNQQVVESFQAIKENLKAVGVDLQETEYQLSPTLAFSPKAERFTDSDKANAMLTRHYRKPFVVPEKIA